jgi:dihydrofolate synthase/folylpolyglutamate synthase
MAKPSSARSSKSRVPGSSAPVRSKKKESGAGSGSKGSRPVKSSAVAREVRAGTTSRLPAIDGKGSVRVGKAKAAEPVVEIEAPKPAKRAKSGTTAKPVKAAKPAKPTKPAKAAKPTKAAKPAARKSSKAAPVVETERVDVSAMSESTRRAIAAATPRSTVEQPPARQLGLRATRPEETATVRPLEVRQGRANDGRAPKTSSDIGNYASAVRYLLERTDFERMRTVKYDEKTFKLDRMEALLAKLGDPHRQIRTVHVGGTNGKGSTVAMIASMLQACGYAVGVYTSPHLVDMRERISINGQAIDRAIFVDLVKQVAKAAEKASVEPTFFEVLTAVCFKHFAEQAVDIAVVEVGLGGRLDSTNVIVPEASVVTSIDLDHTNLLGATVEEIAAEKGGIFKKDVPAFIFESDAAIERVLVECAEKAGAPIRVVNKDIDYSARFCVTDDLGPHTRVCLYTKTSRLEHLPVPLPGEHQASNCGLALAVVDHLKSVGFDCPEDKITLGLAATAVPGRMQLVWDRPRVLVDGAHNPAAVGALMRCVGAHVPYDSMICIFGCCSDKDVPGLIDKVNLGADKVIFTRAAGNPRSADPEDLQKLFAERSGKMSQVARTLPEALEMATRAVSREDLVCVTGSFYLVGETLKHLAHFDRSKGGKIGAEVPDRD